MTSALSPRASLAAGLALVALLACAPRSAPSEAPLAPATSAVTSSATPGTPPAPPLAASSTPPPSASSAPPLAASSAPPPGPPPLTFARAAALLQLGPDDLARCPERQVRCLFAQKFTGALLAEALKFHMETGSVVGLERAHEMDGGYRGMVSIVPATPEGKYARHLGWVLGGLRDLDGLLAWIAPSTGYRASPIGLKFFRSVGKRTPAAYAHDWLIAYNLEGGINTGPDVVRETLMHEVFHLNDQQREAWSERALAAIFDRIVARCGARTPCLAPYAPGTTMVRNGTYYAFQPGNGVAEYAAELGLRYLLEHRRLWRGEPPGKPFKCGPPENLEAWRLLVDEFFAGIDRTAPCPASKKTP